MCDSFYRLITVLLARFEWMKWPRLNHRGIVHRISIAVKSGRTLRKSNEKQRNPGSFHGSLSREETIRKARTLNSSTAISATRNAHHRQYSTRLSLFLAMKRAWNWTGRLLMADEWIDLVARLRLSLWFPHSTTASTFFFFFFFFCGPRLFPLLFVGFCLLRPPPFGGNGPWNGGEFSTDRAASYDCFLFFLFCFFLPSSIGFENGPNAHGRTREWRTRKAPELFFLLKKKNRRRFRTKKKWKMGNKAKLSLSLDNKTQDKKSNVVFFSLFVSSFLYLLRLIPAVV